MELFRFRFRRLTGSAGLSIGRFSLEILDGAGLRRPLLANTGVPLMNGWRLLFERDRVLRDLVEGGHGFCVCLETALRDDQVRKFSSDIDV